MFTRLETEAVNEYLDWHYSLPAEYLRLAKMLVGDLERYMVERLSETFQQPKWYQDFNEELSRSLAVTEEARTELRQVARDILFRNGLDSIPADAQVARTVSLDDILERTFPKCPSGHFVSRTNRLVRWPLEAWDSDMILSGCRFFL